MELRYILCILVILVLCPYGYSELYEGSNCHNQDLLPGICRKLSECPIAVKKFREKLLPNFKICGFTGKIMAIVCCPTDSNRHHRLTNLIHGVPNERKSERACNQYSAIEIEEVDPTLVVGGRNAYHREFPHMAALAFNRSGKIIYECGGTLISDLFVLTAAHCFIYDVTPFRVRLGVTVLNDTDHLDIDIKNVTIHPNYDPFTKHDDIALIELSQRVGFSGQIFPACLYNNSDDPLGLVVTGWGITMKEETYVLQKANLSAVPARECSESIERRSFGENSLRSTEICAKGLRKDSCRGDSGGPLQVKIEKGRYRVVGIVSHGPAGCAGVVPAVYTRVSSYLEWIGGIVWKDDMEE